MAVKQPTCNDIDDMNEILSGQIISVFVIIHLIKQDRTFAYKVNKVTGSIHTVTLTV